MGRRFFSSFLVCSNLELRTFVQSYYTKLLGRGLQFYYKINCDKFELILKIQETHIETRDTYELKVKCWKKIFQANRDKKKAGVAILISDKIDFKTKAVKRDTGH